MALEIGNTVGDYQIVGMLGAGGMGKVYKVRNIISDRIEAMKVLLPDLAGAAELGDRFVREIKVQASLEHPNIAALHTALRVENQLLMLMEFVEGVTLEERLKRGPLPVPEAVNYIAQVLSALSYAHERGVIHRDIKPANMMLTPGGTVKLMDFGIAKAASDRRLTMTGTTMGSLYYMSPEQIKGAADLDARSDLYSVGVSLYELVTGKRPFDGDSQFAIMAAHLEQTPVPPVTVDPNVPQALNDIILLAVAKEPDKRFQTAKAFRNALVNVVAAQPAAPAAAPMAAVAAQIQPPQQPAEGEVRPRSRRGLWIAAGALATALVVIGVIQFGPWRQTSAGTSPVEPSKQEVQAPLQTAPEPVQAPVQQPAPAATPPAQTATPPAVTPPAAAKQQPRSVPARGNVQPAPAQSTQPAPQQAAPPPAAAPVQQQQQQAPAAAAAPAPAPDTRRAELQQIREQVVMLTARAGAVRSSMQNIQRSQAASGLGTRRDMVEASSLMGSFLEGAAAALNAGDAASAKSFAEKAERQIEILEKWLGR
ncbi:MAG: serine/threonine-protein kinase [Bryobacteraceae bacterium]